MGLVLWVFPLYEWYEVVEVSVLNLVNPNMSSVLRFPRWVVLALALIVIHPLLTVLDVPSEAGHSIAEPGYIIVYCAHVLSVLVVPQSVPWSYSQS